MVFVTAIMLSILFSSNNVICRLEMPDHLWYLGWNCRGEYRRHDSQPDREV